MNFKLPRLASSVELVTEQPVGKGKSLKSIQPSSGSSFNHIFGPPTPLSVRRMRNKKLCENYQPTARKSSKPLSGTFSL